MLSIGDVRKATDSFRVREESGSCGAQLKVIVVMAIVLTFGPIAEPYHVTDAARWSFPEQYRDTPTITSELLAIAFSQSKHNFESSLFGLTRLSLHNADHPPSGISN